MSPRVVSARLSGYPLTGLLTLAGLTILLWCPTAALAQRALGIDVSAWQGDISQENWNRVYNEGGRRFAFIRVTHYGEDDRGNPDWYYVQNFARAKAAGLLVGPYHYAIWSRTPQVEAEYFLTYAAPYITPGHLPPMLDLELGDNPGAPVGATSVCDWAQQWIDIVKAQTGVEAGVYLSASRTNTFGGCFSPLPLLWVADWCGDNICTACGDITDPSTQPEYSYNLPPWGHNNWTFWQYCSTGSVPGISGNCDLDVFNGTHTELLECLIGTPNEIVRSPSSLTPTTVAGLNPPDQTFTVANGIEGTMPYNISSTVTWLSVNPSSGESTGPTDVDTITVTYSAGNLPIGVHPGTITITANAASNSPETISVTLTVNPTPGDFDADGHVDSEDTTIFVGCLTGVDPESMDPNCRKTDLDHDDDTDQTDFGILQQCVRGALAPPDPYCAD